MCGACPRATAGSAGLSPTGFARSIAGSLEALHPMKFVAITFFCAGMLCAEAPVTVAQDASVFTLKNSWLTAQVNKKTGNLVSLQFRGIETMGYISGAHAGYWEQNPA